MRIVFLLGAAVCCVASASAQDKLELPDWLSPYPGAAEVISGHTPTNRVSQYTSPAAPADIKAHYLRKIEAAGEKGVVSFDGIGDAVRVTTSTRSAVIRIRASGARTIVDVHVVATEPQSAPPPVQRAAATPVSRSMWPQWLGPPPGHRFSAGPAPVPESRLRFGLGRLYQPCMSATFQTPMTVEDVFRFYDQTLTRNGRRPDRKRLTPGQATLNGKLIGAVQGTIEFSDAAASPPIQGEIIIGWTDLTKPRSGSIWVCADR